jgi:antitoxin Phd
MWQVQEAKAHFSEVMAKAEQEGPQIITRHGAERAVVLSIADYRALTSGKKDFITFLLSGPKFDDFDIERDKDTGREVNLD